MTGMTNTRPATAAADRAAGRRLNSAADLAADIAELDERAAHARTDIDHLTAAGHNCATVLERCVASIVNLTERIEHLEA